ncbi:MAG: hypothetical protein CM15mP86_07850 [Gammaproteobacteria bacterium]|nr:MAG: hypothetical protein CM15mP86_07850 [Gammaproteobacteria bacterium]
MGLIARTFIAALFFSILIFILGANNLFSIKDDFADFSLEMNASTSEIPVNVNRDAFLETYTYTLVIHSTLSYLAPQLHLMMLIGMQKEILLNILLALTCN